MLIIRSCKKMKARRERKRQYFAVNISSSSKKKISFYRTSRQFILTELSTFAISDLDSDVKFRSRVRRSASVEKWACRVCRERWAESCDVHKKRNTTKIWYVPATLAISQWNTHLRCACVWDYFWHREENWRAACSARHKRRQKFLAVSAHLHKNHIYEQCMNKNGCWRA
jgi:hypothetical protein